MSLVHGAIFWNVRSSHQGSLPEQEDINDRLALHYVLGTVAIWPTLMLMISDVWKEKDSIARDIKDRLFGRFIHFLSKVLTTAVSFTSDSDLVNNRLLPSLMEIEWNIQSIGALFGKFHLYELVSQTTSSFLSAGGIFLGYLVPAYTLAGFHSMEGLFIEIGKDTNR